MQTSRHADRTNVEQPPRHERDQADRTASTAAWHAGRRQPAECSLRGLPQGRCQRPSREGEKAGHACSASPAEAAVAHAKTQCRPLCATSLHACHPNSSPVGFCSSVGLQRSWRGSLQCSHCFMGFLAVSPAGRISTQCLSWTAAMAMFSMRRVCGAHARIGVLSDTPAPG